MIKKPIRIKGNALTFAEKEGDSAFAHGCNCFNTMGKGIAFEVRQRFPSLYMADQATKKGDRSKMGGFTFALIGEGNQIGFNLYTQFTYWDKNDMFCPKSFKKAMMSLIRYCHLKKIKALYLPYIGCGLAHYSKSRFEKVVSTVYADWQVEVGSIEGLLQVYFVEYSG